MTDPEQKQEIPVEKPRYAPDGQVWVCLACGKRSKDRYGMQPIDYGWDESCFMNAALCYTDKLELRDCGRVKNVLAGGLVRESEGE